MQRSEWDLPEPPGVQPVRSHPWWKWPVIFLVAVGLAASSFYIPLPMFYAFRPGPVTNIEELVDVSGAPTYSSEGELLMTTVQVDQNVTVSDFIRAMFNSDIDIVSKEDVIPQGSEEEFRQEQAAQMQESQRLARQVALTALGIAHGSGARVVDTLSGFPADGVLQPGDVVQAIDGQEVETTCDVSKIVDAKEVGDPIAITVRRSGERETFELETVADPNDPSAPLVGFRMETFRFEAGLQATFDTGEIAGPSAGLMMSLALYDRLTPGDLTEGHLIAGTGELAVCGTVQAIGGIRQKVAGAEAEGAEIFLAPADNADEAEQAAEGIEIVAIGTFDDALEYLEGLGT